MSHFSLIRKAAALLLCAALLLSGAALAETAGFESDATALESAFSAFSAPPSESSTTTFSINADAVYITPLVESSGAVLPGYTELVIALLNYSSFRVVTASPVSQVDVLLRNTPIISLAGEKTDAEFRLVTDLLGGQVLVFPADAVPQLASLFSAGGTADFSHKWVGTLSSFLEQVGSSAGTPESGTWELDGAVFTTRTPLDVDTRTLVESFLTTLKGLVTDGPLSSLSGSVSAIPTPEKIDETLEWIRNADEADLPAAAAARLSNEAGDVFWDFLLEKDDLRITFSLSIVGGAFRARIDALDIANLELTVNGPSLTAAGRVDSEISGPLLLGAAFTSDNGIMDGTFSLTSEQKGSRVLTFTFRREPGGKVTMRTDNGREVRMDGILSGDMTAFEGVKRDLKGSITGLAIRVAFICPEMIPVMLRVR